MSYLNSAGVYERIIDRSFVVNAGGLVAGGVVISAKKGTTAVNAVTSARQFIETYGTPSKDNPSMYAALRFLNRAGILSVRRVINDAVKATGTLVVGLETLFTVTAENEGAWGNSVSVAFSKDTNQAADVFNIIVKIDGVEAEKYEVSRNPNKKDGYGNNIFIENVVNNRSSLIRIVDNAAVVGDPLMTATITLSGGTNDTVAPTSAQIITAWDDFLDTEGVTSTLLINSGWAVPAVQVKMDAVAKSRKDCIAILDVPESSLDSVNDVLAYRNTDLAIDSNTSALYAGWIRILDQYTNLEVNIPPSGDVAAMIARTIEDGNRWDAMAGLSKQIPNSLGTSNLYNEGDRDILYTNGINPITRINGTNSVVWGQKNLQKAASALDRVPTMITNLWLNQRMKIALQPFVFSPNTVQVRDQINFLLSSFLENVRLQGGLYDFRVVTDETINTPSVIDQQAMEIEVYVKNVRYAEFIRLSLIVTPTGVSLG